MLGPFDYGVVLLAFFAEAYVGVYLLASRMSLRYFSLNLYVFALSAQTITGVVVIRRFGFASHAYNYFYYYTSAVLTILLFFVIMSFYHQVFRQMGAGRYVRGASALLLSATALFSYLVVGQNADHLTDRFVVEMGQNLYFVGVVLTYLLWGAILKLRETRTRLIQLVLALGIFFSADAAAYALRNLFPGLQPEFLKFVPPLLDVFLPIAWAYTFTKVSEDARLPTAKLAPSHQ
jgi:hypothetical protein